MKIDLHVHTKNCKSGDTKNRNVTTDFFAQKVKEADVKVLAITNHNHFDLSQYQELRESVKDYCDVWPGVELDVKELDTNIGHVIVVVSPDFAVKFSNILIKKIGNTSCDNFVMSVTDLTTIFNELNPVIIPHFYKPKSLGQQDMARLEELIYNRRRLLKEPSNITSIGVLNAYNHKCLLGSDVKDWNTYEKCTFSEFKYDFIGFEGFLKLLDKDVAYITDLLNKKFLSEVTVYGNHLTKEFPFSIKVYNDVNIIFGDKGSGKSEIIASLEDYFKSSSKVLRYSGGDKETWFKNLLQVDVSQHSFVDLGLPNDLSSHFKFVKDYTDEKPISIDEYVKYFSNESKNEKRKCFKIIGLEKFNDDSIETINTCKNEHNIIGLFIETFIESQIYKNNPEKYAKLIEELNNAKADSYILFTEQWIKYYSHTLFDFSIDIINQAISECIGNPPVPTTTGFFKFASNRVKLLKSLRSIKGTLETEEKTYPRIYIGDVGDKGSGYVTEHLRLISSLNVDNVDAKYQNGRKEKYKVFNKSLEKLIVNFFCENYSQFISDFQATITEYDIKNIDYFLSSEKVFTLNNIVYNPSRGEKSILAMQHDFVSKKDQYSIFLMDEPESGLGNEYIEKNIVPLIKDLAKSGKTIYIATHNSNIAVRSLPANTILKVVNNENYSTYQGSMFTNKLINLEDANDVKEWNTESEKHLEGGKQAFEERGYYYGENN